MDKRKRYYVTVDVETTYERGKSPFTAPLIYDVAYAIHDRKGIIYEKFECLITEIFTSNLMESAYYANKIPQYMKRLEKNEIEKMHWADFQRKFNKDISKYPNITFMAYNASFDVKALSNTHKYLTGEPKFLRQKVELQDIRSLFMETVYKQRSFVNYARRHELFSESGKSISSTAETAYKYISGDLDFKEEHTAMADVLIEIQIFLQSIRQKQKYEKGIPRNTMKMLIPAIV